MRNYVIQMAARPVKRYIEAHGGVQEATDFTREGEYVGAADYDALLSRFTELEKTLIEILRLCLDHPCDTPRTVENCYSLAKSALFIESPTNPGA